MRVPDLLLGRPIASDEARGEQIGSLVGMSVFGLDALSSAAYGPEAALTLLIPLGAAGIAYIVPIRVSIIVLLAIVYFSYRQTIQAYPSGGGSCSKCSCGDGPRQVSVGRSNYANIGGKNPVTSHSFKLALLEHA
jgi:hypothetical protein